jgi:hypothetical protein
MITLHFPSRTEQKLVSESITVVTGPPFLEISDGQLSGSQGSGTISITDGVGTQFA